MKSMNNYIHRIKSYPIQDVTDELHKLCRKLFKEEGEQQYDVQIDDCLLSVKVDAYYDTEVLEGCEPDDKVYRSTLIPELTEVLVEFTDEDGLPVMFVTDGNSREIVLNYLT